MKKVIKIQGMTCEHCKRNVENALNSLSGVRAKVNLKKGIAVVSLAKHIPNYDLENAVTEAGYTVVAVSDKKRLLGII